MQPNKKKQIDVMINEGLGAGQINNVRDKKKLLSPLSKVKHENKKENFNDNVVKHSNVKQENL